MTAIVIEQSQKELTDSQSVSSNANINSVRVLFANYWRKSAEQLKKVSSPLNIATTFTPKSILQSGQQLIADIEFVCRIFPRPEIESKVETRGDEEPEDVIRIECVLEATYRLAESYSPSDEQKIAFHRGNIVYNCWPFFREFVQSSAARMEIPPPPIPFLKVQITPSNESANLSPEPQE